MRIFPLVVLSMICIANSYGQAAKNYYIRLDVEITKERKPKRIYTKVEISDSFPGGDSAWVQSLEKKLNESIPFRNGAKKGKYNVSVKFIISKDGTMSDVQCDKDPGYGMCEAVRRTLIKKGSKWFPAEQNGRKVSSYRGSSGSPDQ